MDPSIRLFQILHLLQITQGGEGKGKRTTLTKARLAEFGESPSPLSESPAPASKSEATNPNIPLGQRREGFTSQKPERSTPHQHQLQKKGKVGQVSPAPAPVASEAVDKSKNIFLGKSREEHSK